MINYKIKSVECEYGLTKVITHGGTNGGNLVTTELEILGNELPNKINEIIQEYLNKKCKEIE